MALSVLFGALMAASAMSRERVRATGVLAVRDGLQMRWVDAVPVRTTSRGDVIDRQPIRDRADMALVAVPVRIENARGSSGFADSGIAGLVDEAAPDPASAVWQPFDLRFESFLEGLEDAAFLERHRCNRSRQPSRDLHVLEGFVAPGIPAKSLPPREQF